jgi:hypothetical protein
MHLALRQETRTTTSSSGWCDLSYSERATSKEESSSLMQTFTSSSLLTARLQMLFKETYPSSSTSLIQEYSRDLKTLTKTREWITKFYEEASTLSTVKTLVPYYKEINGLVHKNEYEECDIFLRHVKTKNLTDVLLVGLVRLTYSKKEHLSSWNELLEKVSFELDERGYDKYKMLKGIL